jgi:hypothetical protein
MKPLALRLKYELPIGDELDSGVTATPTIN